MAEFKNVFIKSKMNKDLDDRLLPQGEYRDAQNIQVSKSESEDVGALENVLGNKKILDFATATGQNDVVCIGRFVSEEDSTVYFFLTNNTDPNNLAYNKLGKNFIVAANINIDTVTTNILVQGAFLNFHISFPVLGVNLLEELLFFTDNRNQPRKINVNRPIASPNYYQIEDTISVAKFLPYEAPLLYQQITQEMVNANANLAPALNDYQTTMQDVVSQYLPDSEYSSPGTSNPYYNSLYKGDPDYLEDKFVRFSYRFKFDDNEYSVFAPFTQEAFIPQQDGYFLFQGKNLPNPELDNNDQSASFRSTIVDFMENKVNQITLIIPMPSVGDPALPTTNLGNVVDQFKITELEILFKESDGNAALVVDTIPASTITAQYDSNNPTNNFEYVYSGTKPFRTLPESQITRVYDKVPVKALGQEVISNRIVYSNFQTKHTPPSGINYNTGVAEKLNFNVTLNPSTNPTTVGNTTSIVEYPNSTLKQNRNYQAGFVLSDRFGRTTSTILSNGGSSGAGDVSFSTVFTPYNEAPPTGPDIGQWAGDALFIQINDPIDTVPVASSLYPGVYNGDPADVNYNPLGFFSWKIVVKQQEQDYYNVYLPGIMAAYPDSTSQELGQTSHVVLINDNINKVPRDLAEVGPDQKQFRSSVQLFGRVENTITAITTANLGASNVQYYPTLKSDTVSTISTVNDLFDTTAQGGNFEQFYEFDSNPLIARISTQKQIGQIATTNPPTGLQFLAVYETEPVESRLDIYWETSTSGKVTDLNTQVDAVGGQTIFDLQGLNWGFTEGYGVYTGSTTSPEPGTDARGGSNVEYARAVVAGPFKFINSAGVAITKVELIDYTITNDNNNIVATKANPTDFELIKISGTANGGPGDYTDYNGNQQPANPSAEDIFILVNKTYRLWQNSQPHLNDQKFNINIQVRDLATNLTQPTPVFTKTLTSLANGTNLANNTTVYVGGTASSPASSWGSTTQPLLWNNTVLTPSPLLLAFGIPPGTTMFTVIGNNGANSDNSSNPNNNQTGLVFSIVSQTQNSQAVSEFIIGASNGQVEQVTGNASGAYTVQVRIDGPDGTFDLQTFNVVVGKTPVDGSFYNNNGPFQIDIDNAALINAHNSLIDFVQNTDGFTETTPFFKYLDPSDPASTCTNSNALDGCVLSSTCQSGIPNNGNANFTSSYQLQGNQGSGGYGLSQGTAYARLDFLLDLAGLGNTGDLAEMYTSWSVEYRPNSSSPWVAATDIEGNSLSFNSQVSGSVTTPELSNDTAVFSDQGNKMNYGTINSSYPTVSVTPVQSIGVAARRAFTQQGTDGFALYSKWVAFGENQGPYNVNNYFGEYRFMVQSLGADCTNCQGCGSSGSRIVAFDGTSYATINFGDFYYDIGGTNRAFEYRISSNGVATKAAAEQGGISINTSQVVYAREPIARYVSTFYTDLDLSIPATFNFANGSFFTYIASGPASGALLPGGAQTNSNTAFALADAMEYAGIASGSGCEGINSTVQGNRRWTCEIQNNASGTKVQGSSEPLIC